MPDAVDMVELWRGPFLESMHRGHAVICDDTGQIVQAWGNPEAVVLPRSSSKMIQALPLVTSGAAAARGLGSRQLALACASHNAAAIHVDAVRAWLDDLGKTDDDFRCGPQEPRDIALRDALIRAGESPCRIHNNCSGKHAGFLTLADHLGAGPDYVDPDHPVQKAVKEAHEEITGEPTPGFGVDGCSAPNFATTLHGMARAMARFAAAREGTSTQASAAAALRDAMIAHPELVAGEGRACTELMRACDGRVALKTGAEAFFIAIIPEKKLGVALKITDGGTRAAECAIGAILIRLGLLDPAHPAARSYVNAPIRNWDGLETGRMQPTAALA
ncbi:asparaginase [Lutimaribacter sp. EGI FJ00015]|uniref:Asparaginase n=1 Tax=Lutimaribacter degradans TaxID=2945989 RepID=A0ACC5ZXR1_9RHOB|nr:asparaginase [Lutimaribacter sp. EGI FJ00013]MCM2562827.1 asparaginase [Lutimaribacter sp. EGI FJ00013]MCO0613984.1 asparaginase [Lutimaribacter sp. EGI FJ00015]MCO0636956.1 asparaginase [Lutimaribacter sp. EGI FJ00014]